MPENAPDIKAPGGREMSSTSRSSRAVQLHDPNLEPGGADSPTQLVRQILRHRGPVSHSVDGDEGMAATVSVMLRVQPPPSALLMVDTSRHERLQLALHAAGFDVTAALTQEQAAKATASRHHALAVTDRLEWLDALRTGGTSRLLQIIQITAGANGEVETALCAGADECLDDAASDTLLQARFSSARRMADLESALRATFIVGRRLSTTDELTGVANRRFFAKHYPWEIARAARHGHAVAVAMCDIDHFKRVNDGHGHATGDLVLRECAKRMQQCLRRGTDWIARLGGDEFAIVLPETNLEQALAICRNLRNAICLTPFGSDGEHMNLTASFGLAGMDSVPANAERLAKRLLNAADQALYRRKEAGRDGITALKLDCASPPEVNASN
jgi:two-component system, cell cycle response regulator